MFAALGSLGSNFQEETEERKVHTLQLMRVYHRLCFSDGRDDEPPVLIHSSFVQSFGAVSENKQRFLFLNVPGSRLPVESRDGYHRKDENHRKNARFYEFGH